MKGWRGEETEAEYRNISQLQLFLGTTMFGATRTEADHGTGKALIKGKRISVCNKLPLKAKITPRRTVSAKNSTFRLLS